MALEVMHTVLEVQHADKCSYMEGVWGLTLSFFNLTKNAFAMSVGLTDGYIFKKAIFKPAV